MRFRLLFTREAKANLAHLESDAGFEKRLRAIRKCLSLIESNPRHPGLQTHEFKSLSGPRGEKIFEAYADQATPAAYRVFWHYGPDRGEITIVVARERPGDHRGGAQEPSLDRDPGRLRALA